MLICSLLTKAGIVIAIPSRWFAVKHFTRICVAICQMRTSLVVVIIALSVYVRMTSIP